MKQNEELNQRLLDALDRWERAYTGFMEQEFEINRQKLRNAN